MSNKEIINYIKIREQWKDAQRDKSRAWSSIYNGLFNFGTFLAYWAVDKFYLKLDEMLKEFPNMKYIFYLSLALGLLGLVNAMVGVINYFQASEKAEELEWQVRKLEKELKD